MPVIPPNTPFKIAFEAGPTDNFRWWCNGEIKKNFAEADLTKGAATPDGYLTYEATVPGLPAGLHTCLVSAWKVIEGSPTGEAWPDAKGAPIPGGVLVGVGPLTPINLRVIVTIIVK